MNCGLGIIRKLRIYLFFATLIIVWGINWPINKIGMQYMPAIWHAAIRLSIGCLSMFVVAMLLGKCKFPSKKDWPAILILGTLQMGLFTLLINMGLNYVEAGRSAMLVYTAPLWVIPLAMLVFNEKITVLKLLGFILGLSGVMVLFSPWSIDWAEKETVYGHIILLLAALTFALAICSARNIKWTSSPLTLLPWQLLIGALPVLVMAFMHSPISIIEWNATSLSAMLYTGILATGLGNFWATMINKELPSITAALGFLGVPISGVLCATWILDEPITPSIKIALLLIPAGLFCVALGNLKRFQK